MQPPGPVRFSFRFLDTAHPSFRVSARGGEYFRIPGHEDADLRGWQFALSANEHGRVHGFLAGETFYVRWLDPDHNLYPGRN